MSFNLKKSKKNLLLIDRWYVFGPGEYFPSVEVQVLERRKALVQLEGLGVCILYILYHD